MKQSNLSIGEKIKELRIRNGLTQDDLSQVLMITRQTISSWERNKSIPDIQMLQTISKHFGVSNDYLVVDSFSKIRDMLLRYNVWLIIFATLFLTGAGIIYFNNINEVYDNKFADFRGLCSEVGNKDITAKLENGTDILLEEQLNVTLDGREYCFPTTFYFETEDKIDEETYVAERITPPLGVRINETYATIHIQENGIWKFIYRVRVLIIDDEGQTHEEVVRSERDLDIVF